MHSKSIFRRFTFEMASGPFQTLMHLKPPINQFKIKDKLD